MAYGFYEMEAHGVRGIGHGGDTSLFHSELLLLPEHNVGLFVSYGSSGLPGYDLLPAFIGRYFAAPDPAPPEPPAGFEERTKRVAGVYRFTRHNYTSIEKAFALPSVVSVAAGPKGTITTSIQGLGDPWLFREVTPNYYEQIDGTMRLVFREAADGSITNMYFSLLPFMPCYRVAWYATPTVNYFLLGATLFLCVSTLVAFCYHRKGRREDPTLARWSARLGAITALATLAFVAGLAALVSAGGEEFALRRPEGPRRVAGASGFDHNHDCCPGRARGPRLEEPLVDAVSARPRLAVRARSVGHGLVLRVLEHPRLAVLRSRRHDSMPARRERGGSDVRGYATKGR